jgi:hypothetical protein
MKSFGSSTYSYVCTMVHEIPSPIFWTIAKSLSVIHGVSVIKYELVEWYQEAIIDPVILSHVFVLPEHFAVDVYGRSS